MRNRITTAAIAAGAALAGLGVGLTLPASAAIAQPAHHRSMWITPQSRQLREAAISRPHCWKGSPDHDTYVFRLIHHQLKPRPGAAAAAPRSRHRGGQTCRSGPSPERQPVSLRPGRHPCTTTRERKLP